MKNHTDILEVPMPKISINSPVEDSFTLIHRNDRDCIPAFGGHNPK